MVRDTIHTHTRVYLHPLSLSLFPPIQYGEQEIRRYKVTFSVQFPFTIT